MRERIDFVEVVVLDAQEEIEKMINVFRDLDKENQEFNEIYEREGETQDKQEVNENSQLTNLQSGPNREKIVLTGRVKLKDQPRGVRTRVIGL